MTKKYCKKIVKIIIMILLVLLILYNFMNINNKEQFIKLFDYKIMVVEEYQRQRGIDNNDIIISKENSEGYAIDDLVVIRVNETLYFRRIIEIKEGNKYITKGDGNYKADKGPIEIEQIEGKVIKQIQDVGIILKIVKSKSFSVIIVLIVIMLFYYNTHIYKKRINRRFKQKNSLGQ